MSFRIECGLASLTGRRERNEDFAGARYPETPADHDKGVIVAIADGVSAGGAGDEAARASVRSLLADYYATPATWATSTALDRLLSAQNAWLHAQNRRREASREMATTLTAVVLRGRTWTLAHVGDTRAYLVRDGKTELLTTDHSHGGEWRARLTRALGIDDHVVIDSAEGSLDLGDTLFLLSDGAWTRLKPRELAQAAGQTGTPDDICNGLADLAYQRGADDNITVLLARVAGLPTADLRADTMRAHRAEPLRRLRPGERTGDLVVEAVLSDNGVTILYRVRKEPEGETLVLKTLAPSRANDADERANLAHEAWLAGRIDSPHFVRARQTFGAGGLSIVFDWHEGETLEQRLARRPLPDAAQCVDVGRQLLTALSALHRRGIVHRDIKPANLHLGADGVLRVLDLGVAVSGNEPKSLLDVHAGTPSYVEPEQWDGAPSSAASDLFAAGVTLYRFATGRLPYGEVLPYQAGRYRRDPPAVTRSRPDIPKWLDTVILKAVSRQREDRFETAEEFHLALERGAARPLPPARPTPLLSGDRLGWQVALGISLLVNVALVVLLLIVGR